VDSTETYDRLVKLLVQAEFDTRYYGFVEATKLTDVTLGIDSAQAFEAIELLPITFKFNKKEGFFFHRASKNPELGLNLALTPQAAEFILVFKPECGHIGDTFPVLARDAMRQRRADPSLNYSPPYPKLRFGTDAQLQQVLSFGLTLYADVEREIKNEKKW
jgi:hypothetical protein